MVETRNRHSSYFSDLIGSFETELRGGIGSEALQTIFPEQANLAGFIAMGGKGNLKHYWMLGTVWQGLGDSRAGNLWKKGVLC